MKIRFSLAIILLFSIGTSAQDTIYFDKDWFVSEKTSAVLYTTVTKVAESEIDFVVMDFTIDGTLLSKYNYKAVQPEIDWRRIYETDFHEFAFEHGISIEYFPTGKQKRRLEFLNGKQDGLITVWDKDGKKEREFMAVNKIANGTYVEYFKNGESNFTVNFKNDTLHGKAIYFYPNGKVSQLGDFKNGEKFGKWKYYSEEGELMSEENYKSSFFISGPNVKIDFPKGSWYLADTFKEDDRLNFLFYRNPTIDNSNVDEGASCLLSLETLEEGMELIEYSSHRRRRVSIDVRRVITKENKLFTLSETIGYFGMNSDSDKRARRVVLLHSIQNNVGLEIILDCATIDYEKLKDEFKYIVKTLRKD